VPSIKAKCKHDNDRQQATGDEATGRLRGEIEGFGVSTLRILGRRQAATAKDYSWCLNLSVRMAENVSEMRVML